MTHQSSSSSVIHHQLKAMADLVRGHHRFDATSREALADLIDELDKALSSGAISEEEARRMAACVTHLTEAIHRDDDRGVLAAARDRLELAVVAAQNKAPGVAGLAIRFMDALANIGI